MADELPIPKSRTESYLAKAAGEDVPIPEEPRSRLEQYLNAIAENGGGGGGGTSNFDQLTNRPKYNGSEMTSSTDIPEVKTYTAGSNISISAGNEISATDTKYTAGTNVSISDQNVISATDTTYSNFTGTDGTTAGTAGLVPAPTTTDGDKYLKGDGTWGTVQAGSSYTAGDGINISAQDVISATNTGKARILTTADYNANSSNWSDTDPANFNCVASWKLESGLYCVGENSLTFYDSRTRPNTLGKGTLIVAGGDSTTNNRRCILLCLPGNATITKVVNQSDGSLVNVYTMVTGVINNLVSTSTTDALSANQGKVLKDLVDSLAIRGAGAPTTSTAGQVGTLYEDTTNGKLYICTDATNPYVWEEVGGGSGPTVVQTTGTSQTDVMSQNAVTGMMFADPGSRSRIQIGHSASAVPGSELSIAIGGAATVYSNAYFGVAIGANAAANSSQSVAIGRFSSTSQRGEFSIGGSRLNGYGYNNSAYRLLTNVYDGQSAHDAATYGQVISYSAINGAGAPTTTTEGKYVGQLYYDTTNEAMYFLKTIDTTTTPATYTWEALGGGSSVNVVQTTGTSTTDVMSQNAVTSMVFNDPSTKARVKIGAGATISNSGSLAIGNNAVASNYGSAAIGAGTASAYYTVSLFTEKNIDKPGSIGLGKGATVTRNGEMNIGDSTGYYAHNGSNYRILSGLYDPEEAHDAATKGYVDGLVGDIEAALNAINNGGNA